MSDTSVIILFNSVHPDGPKSITALSDKICDAAAIAIGIKPDAAGSPRTSLVVTFRCAACATGRSAMGDVKTGIDVFEADHFQRQADLAREHDRHIRLSLLTNQTRVDADGHRIIANLFHDARRLFPASH